jgi:hypothetical protein
MKHHRESTGISNFGQLRHHPYTLSVRGVRLHNSSAKEMIFGLPKSGGFVLALKVAPTPDLMYIPG